MCYKDVTFFLLCDLRKKKERVQKVVFEKNLAQF